MCTLFLFLERINDNCLKVGQRQYTAVQGVEKSLCWLHCELLLRPKNRVTDRDFNYMHGARSQDPRVRRRQVFLDNDIPRPQR